MKSPHAASSFHASLRIATRLIAGVLLVCGLPTLASAQNSNPPETIVDHIHGVVLSSVDGKPIFRALVTSNDQRFAMMTDSEGRFSLDLRRPAADSSNFDLNTRNGFPRMGQLNVFLSVRRPGYLPSNASLRISTDPQSATEEAQIKLVPESMIRGHLSTSNVTAPSGIQVQLRRKQVQEGAATWIQSGNTQANSRGDFRFPDLPAGDYKVTTQAWTGQAYNSTEDQTSGYSPARYADAADLASTPSIHLHPGETAVADLNLRASTLYHVTIPIANAPKNAGVNFFIGDEDEQSGFPMNYKPQAEALEGYLPNGAYTIRISAFAQPQGGSGKGRVEVSGRPVKASPITLIPNGQIPVYVHQQYTAANPNSEDTGRNLFANRLQQIQRRSLDISLRPLSMQGPGANLKNTPAQSDDDLVLENVQEGAYRVSARAFRGYIASMTSNGVDLLRQPLIVGSGGAAGPIDVTLRDDSATLSGTVSVSNSLPTTSTNSAGNLLGSGNYIVTCIPLDGNLAEPPGQTLAFNAGKFTIPNLPPGDYLVLASSTQLMNLEYQNPDILNRYKLKGTTVTLSPGQKAQIEVPLLPESDIEPEN